MEMYALQHIKELFVSFHFNGVPYRLLICYLGITSNMKGEVIPAAGSEKREMTVWDLFYQNMPKILLEVALIKECIKVILNNID